MDYQGSSMGNRSWGQVGSHTGDVWGNLCGLVCSVPLQFFAKLWKIIRMHSLFGAWRFAIFPENKSRITILYGFISLLINQLLDPIGAYSTPLSVAWWGKQVMRRGRSHPHPHLGGAPAPSQTPPFTWGGIRPPHTTQKVGLWPPHLMLLGDGCG